MESANLLASQKPHLLFILNQLKVDMQKLIFCNGNTFKMQAQREQSRKAAKLTDISKHILIHFTCILNQTSSSHFRPKSGYRNEREYYVH